MLNREGFEEITIGFCLVGAKDAREDEAPDPREFRDALDTVASVVRFLDAMVLFLREGAPPCSLAARPTPTFSYSMSAAPA